MKQHLTAKKHPDGYTYATAREKNNRNGTPRHRVVIIDGSDFFEIIVTGYFRSPDEMAETAMKKIARELGKEATV